MLIEERRQHLLAKIQSDHRVLVSELSDSLGISRITIRKDLDYLESRGLVQRTHGGALSPHNRALLDPSLQEKEHKQQEEKERIGKAAASLVEEGMCVLLDSGTTTTAVARQLRRFTHLTVITNAVNIAAELTGTSFDVILTGGNLRNSSFSLVGPLAEDTLTEMHGDILFLGVDGFDMKLGLTTPNLMEARVNRAMVHAAARVIVVCDSTKFGRCSLAVISSLKPVDTVVTDERLSKEDAEALASLGIKVIRA